MSRKSLVIALWSLTFAAACAAADRRTPAIDEVRLGLGGEVKLGHWSPLRVVLRAGDSPLRGELKVSVPDGDDVWSSYSGGGLANIDIPAGQRRAVVGYVRVGRKSGSVVVRFQSDDGKHTLSPRATPLEQLAPAISAGSQRVVVVGEAIGMDQARRYLPRREGEALVATQIDDPKELPDRWYGYDGVNLLVLTTSRPELYEQLSPQQQEAIATWLRLGGRLMMTVGGEGERALAAPGILASLAPGTWQRTAALRETSALETLAESPLRLDAPIDGEAPPALMLTQLRSPRGQVLLAAPGGRALVLQNAFGLGQVTFVGIDLDQPPIAGWAERGRLVARMLEFSLREAAPAGESHPGGEAAHLGFDDLSGQLRAALDQFAGVRVVPFSLIAGLMIAYILLIGPGDYFLLRKFIGRMELTWATFALTVIVFGGIAWWLASRVRSSRTLVNQVDVVDVDLTTSLVRGTTWLRLYSPSNRQLDLALELSPSSKALAEQPEMLFGWQGLPGKGLGGMDDRSRLAVGGPSYEIRDASAEGRPARLKVESLPLGHGATKGFLGRWWSPVGLEADYQLRYRTGKLLDGRIVNPLPVRLTHCLLYHDRWAYQLGTLEPGQQAAISDRLKYLNTRWLLTERTVVEGREQTDLWDHAMRDDVPKLARMMMFHEAAGGRAHTGLFHRYQGFIDLSSHLPADRAILVGRAEVPATRLTADGEPLSSDGDRHWTFYRIVFQTTPAE